ncbi:MAG TPA: hypothetical protein VH187_05595 [Scandinavium sp.]|jgi:hypothetical protein|uniref:hypothetical protein n=1 Tax=Scandinavium sp. TaxID=2830653 RepID=UPI002E346357|nr:hypothetical protein [Scandinavium sp.]HEX4500635.1 hypothetical protein [Scandinavium sp.]
MTVSAINVSITYQGDGVTTLFAFPFPVINPTDIIIFISTGTDVILGNPATYQVFLNPPVAPNPTPVGGSVLYPVVGGGVPVPVGQTITIYRQQTTVQETSFANQSVLYQTVIEQTFDFVTMLTQQLQEVTDRCIQGSPIDPAMAQLPPAAVRANMFLAFDSMGNPMPAAGVVLGNVVISPAMVPVVTAATVQVAATALGIGTPAFGLQFGVSAPGNLDQNIQLVHVATDTILDTFDHMSRIICDVTLNITLPKVSTLWNGWGVWINSRSHVVNVIPDAGDSIDPLAMGEALVMEAAGGDTTIFIQTDGGGVWFF